MAPVDRSVFLKSETVDAVRVPCGEVGRILKHDCSQSFIWTRRGRKSVYPCPNDPKSWRIVLLKDNLPDDLRGDSRIFPTSFVINTSYEDFGTDEALRVLLRDIPDPPSSFETIGYDTLQQGYILFS